MSLWWYGEGVLYWYMEIDFHEKATFHKWDKILKDNQNHSHDLHPTQDVLSRNLEGDWEIDYMKQIEDTRGISELSLTY